MAAANSMSFWVPHHRADSAGSRASYAALHLPGRGERGGHPLGGELAAGDRELGGEPGRRQSGLGAVPVQVQQLRFGVGQHREVRAGQPGLHMGAQIDPTRSRPLTLPSSAPA